MNKDHEYSILLFIIAIWVMVGGIAQCHSAIELNNIEYKLNMMRYK